MYVDKLILNNVGPHQRLEVKLRQGLVGLIGPNGAGKSTLVNAIYAALTNDWTRFVGVKADVICDLIEKGDSAYVDLHAVHNGVPFRLYRGLAPNKSELKIGDEKSITKAPEIEARLRKDLGVDMKLIGEYVFVDQGRMFSFLDMTPAVRAEAFKYLCRTQQASVIFDACAEQLGIFSNNEMLVDNSDELTTQIAENQAKLRILQAELAREQKLLLNPASLETAKQLKKNHERRGEVEADLLQTETKLKKRRAELKICTQQVADLSKKLEDLKTSAAELKPQAVAAEAALKTWSTYTKRRKRKDQLNALCVELLEEPLANPEPEKASEKAIARYRSFIAAAETTKNQATKLLSKFAEGEEAQCPTCLQAVGTKHVAKFRNDLKTAEATLQDLQPKLDAELALVQAKQDWAEWKSGYDARLAAAKTELESFNDLKEPAGNKDELQTVVDTFLAVESEVELAREALDDAREASQDVQAEINSFVTQQQTLQNKLAECTVEPAKLAKVTKRLTEHEAATVHVANVSGQISQIEGWISADQEKLDALRAVLGRQKKTRVAAKTLEAVRDVFHWSRLPHRVARGNLSEMEGAINKALGWFGDPFWVETAESESDLGFMVHLPGHPPCPAERLSGGQKGVFAVAFRYSISSLFDADIGMMYLDEPTANMDDENVGYFTEALKKLAVEVRGKRQLVVITHHKRLLSAFDQVIEVGGYDHDAG